MPDYSSWGHHPIPTPAEAAEVPADLMALVESLDPHTVQFAASIAERNAKFAGLPAGALVVCRPLKTIWMSLGGTAWQTVYSDSGWITLGFAWAPGFADTNNRSRQRRIGDLVHIDLYADYSGATITASAAGGIPDTQIVNIATNRPQVVDIIATVRAGGTGGGGYLSPSGDFKLSDLHSSSSIVAGNAVRTSIDYVV